MKQPKEQQQESYYVSNHVDTQEYFRLGTAIQAFESLLPFMREWDSSQIMRFCKAMQEFKNSPPLSDETIKKQAQELGAPFGQLKRILDGTLRQEINEKIDKIQSLAEKQMTREHELKQEAQKTRAEIMDWWAQAFDNTLYKLIKKL